MVESLTEWCKGVRLVSMFFVFFAAVNVALTGLAEKTTVDLHFSFSGCGRSLPTIARSCTVWRAVTCEPYAVCTTVELTPLYASINETVLAQFAHSSSIANLKLDNCFRLRESDFRVLRLLQLSSLSLRGLQLPSLLLFTI